MPVQGNLICYIFPVSLNKGEEENPSSKQVTQIIFPLLSTGRGLYEALYCCLQHPLTKYQYTLKHQTIILLFHIKILA